MGEGFNILCHEVSKFPLNYLFWLILHVSYSPTFKTLGTIPAPLYTYHFVIRGGPSLPPQPWRKACHQLVVCHVCVTRPRERHGRIMLWHQLATLVCSCPVGFRIREFCFSKILYRHKLPHWQADNRSSPPLKQHQADNQPSPPLKEWPRSIYETRILPQNPTGIWNMVNYYETCELT